MGLFKHPAPPVDIVRDRWNGYTYLFGERERCVVSFDVTACELEAQRPSQLRRVIGFSPESHIGRDGMPSAQAFARLKAIEEALLHQLHARKVKSWLVGKQVYRGFRELLFQVDDVAGFAKAYDVVEAEFGGMKLVEHADWQFFNDKISPGVRGQNHIGNREVIAALKSAGSDLASEHTLEHVFIGEADGLDALAADLAARELGTSSRHGDSLTVSIDAPLDDQDLIDAMTMCLRDLGDEHDVDYDGWGAAVRR